MTKREASIISAYTGVLIGDFSEMHKYVEGIFGRPVFIHEFANEDFTKEVKDKSKKDFIEIEVS